MNNNKAAFPRSCTFNIDELSALLNRSLSGSVGTDCALYYLDLIAYSAKYHGLICNGEKTAEQEIASVIGVPYEVVDTVIDDLIEYDVLDRIDDGYVVKHFRPGRDQTQDTYERGERRFRADKKICQEESYYNFESVEDDEDGFLSGI